MEEHSKKEKKDEIYKGHRNKLEKKKILLRLDPSLLYSLKINGFLQL